jgi:predicted RNA-binding protein associated with RNAse of E/G family
VDIVDHQLDLVVSPDRAVDWKDEDELAAAVDAGWLTDAESEAIYAEAHRLAALAKAGDPPFTDALHHLRPDAVSLPRLPADYQP